MRAAKNIIIVLLAAGLLVGLWTVFNMHKQIESLRSALQEIPAPVETAQTPDYVTIYLVKSEPTEFLLVPVQRKTGGPVSPAAALQALINGPLVHEDLQPSVPHTAVLRSLTVENGLASADFSAELVRDFNGGALLESYLVSAIVNTLTEFPEIQRVQILVEGAAVESIGGHVLVNKPLSRTP
ncbi:MAG TPA: GerMN domain-containing protein [Firmicutes bacterium]|jgi:germination protein M|nr:GerMN domain-containing protein [Bacillota bacterium]